ncbi:MAG: hypothetical protein ABSD20_05405 [Terriglobales bacterium]
MLLFAGGLLQAQDQDQLRLNVVNACTPDETEKNEISAALAHIPEHPRFTSDYEIARGHTNDNKGASDWVRLRREFSGNSAFTSVQFLLSVSGPSIEETLVLHLKGSKPGEPLQISLEHETSEGTAAAVLAAGAPPNRIRLERYGKPSLILARCPQADQQAYEPLFAAAASRFMQYRAAMNARSTVTAELAKMKKGGSR